MARSYNDVADKLREQEILERRDEFRRL